MLLFAEHFDGYNTIEELWNLKNSRQANRGANSYDSVGGRWGGGAIKPISLGKGNWFPLFSNPTVNLVRVAFWFKSNQAGTATGNRPIIALRNHADTYGWYFYNSGTAGSTKLGCCLFDDDLSPVISVSSATTIGDNSWHHVELELKSENTTNGIMKIWIDGVLDTSSISAGDTSGIAGATPDVTIFDYIEIAGCASNTASQTDIFIDDVIVWDDTGTGFVGKLPANDLHRLRVTPAKANGTVNEFTPSAGNNYENVDETLSDSETTFNETSVVGEEDRYKVNNQLGYQPDKVHAVIIENDVKRTGIKTMNIRGLVDVSGTTSYGSSQVAGPGYLTHMYVAEKAPDTTVWTGAKINLAEFGLEYNS